jgi:hypothetical protein
MICDDYHWASAWNLLEVAFTGAICYSQAAEQAFRERPSIPFGPDQRVDSVQAEYAGHRASQRFRYGSNAVKNCGEIHCLSNAPGRRIYSGFATESRRLGF